MKFSIHVYTVLTNSLIVCSTGGSASGDDNNTGAIVGGVIGGLCGAILLIVLILLLWYFVIRKKRLEKGSRASMEHMCASCVQIFMVSVIRCMYIRMSSS